MGQRNLSPVKNCPRGQGDLVPTASTLPPLVHQLVGSPVSALRAMKPSGQRQAARYCWQASSLAKSA